MATNNTTMQKQDAGSKLRGMIERAQTAFAAVLPKHMNAERVTRIAMSAITRDHKLAECEPATVLRCVMEAACVGLEVNTPAQHAYLIPRKNKGGFMECTLQFGYRGLIDLARRSGAVSEVEAHVVHERDVFECRQGTDKAIKHLPAMKNPGEVIAAYSIAWMAGPDRRWQAVRERPVGDGHLGDVPQDGREAAVQVPAADARVGPRRRDRQRRRDGRRVRFEFRHHGRRREAAVDGDAVEGSPGEARHGDRG
jgi:phage RecT family recombinase